MPFTAWGGLGGGDYHVTRSRQHYPAIRDSTEHEGIRRLGRVSRLSRPHRAEQVSNDME